jgi:hypothetical protein
MFNRVTYAQSLLKQYGLEVPATNLSASRKCRMGNRCNDSHPNKLQRGYNPDNQRRY